MRKTHESSNCASCPDTQVRVDLNTLPIGHRLRNTPLGATYAQYRHGARGAFRAVDPRFVIARATYNELGPAWTRYTQWRVAKPSHEA